MEKNSITKKNHIVPVIFCVVVVLLSITVLLQTRRIDALNKKWNNTPAVNNQFFEDVDIYKEKIKKLETQIADMQSWQDYLEDALEKSDDRKDSTPDRPQSNTVENFSPVTRNPDSMTDYIKMFVFKPYDSFVKENNLSPDIKTKFFDLLAEKHHKIREIWPSVGDLRSGEITPEESRQMMEEIDSEYNEQIADLLSAADYNAFQEYEKVKLERAFIEQFKKTALGNVPLEKNQEKELIAALYNKGQNYDSPMKDRGGLELQSFKDPESLKEEIKKRIENQLNLYSGYLEAAKDILSEPQMKKFESYVIMQKSGEERMSRDLPKMDLGFHQNDIVLTKDKTEE